MYGNKKDGEEILMKINWNKVQTSIAVVLAMLFFFVVVFFSLQIFSIHKAAIVQQELLGMKASTPEILTLTLNEWGDTLAGFGASIAFIFVSLGLFLQMKELSAQRKEMGEAKNEQKEHRKEMIKAREEQEKATAELVNSRIDENLRAMFNMANDQLKAQPVLVTALRFLYNSRSSIPTDKNRYDRLVFKVKNLSEFPAHILSVTAPLGFTGKERNSKIVLVRGEEDVVELEFDCPATDLPTFDTNNYKFEIRFSDALGYIRDLNIEYTGNRMARMTPPPEITELKEKRTFIGHKLNGRNEELLSRNP